MASSSEFRARLKSLPKADRSEVARAITEGRAVSNPALAPIAAEFASRQRQVLRRTLILMLPAGLALGGAIIWILDRRSDDPLSITALAVILVITGLIALLIFRRQLRRLGRAEELNSVGVAPQPSSQKAVVSDQLSTDEEELPTAPRRLALVSVCLLVIATAWSGIAIDGFPKGLNALIAPAIGIAVVLAFSARRVIGGLTIWLLIVHGLGLVTLLSPPVESLNVAIAMLPLAGFIAAAVARVQTRGFRRRRVERQIALGGDPPWPYKSWWWFKRQPLWIKIPVGLVTVVVLGSLVAAVIAAAVDPS